MIDFEKLKAGDNFFECCDYHWMTRLEFVKLNKDGKVKCKYATDFGIYKTGESHQGIIKSEYENCFITRNEAVIYQNECKLKMKKVGKDELLKLLYEKCRASGGFSKEEEVLYKDIIYGK